VRVLYLTLNPNRVSTTVPTEGWFRLLRPQGLEPVLASCQSGAFQQWAREQGIPTYDVPMPFPSLQSPLPFGRALAALHSIARRHEVDLVHSNEHDVYPIAQYVARLRGVPRVASVHFTMDRPFCQWAFGGRRAPHRLFFVSRSSQEICAPALEGIVTNDRQAVLRNGLDLERFRPDAGRRARFRDALGLGDAPTIGVACALRPRKQLEHLFTAAGRLDPSVQVVVAGGPVPGDEEYARRLIADARGLLGERLHLLGHVDELRDFYAGLDLFVNTSREEACSISVIESLACGTPVVGYASKSVDEQILPGGGEIVPQDDSGMLSQALDAWLSNPARVAEAREGARRQAEKLFDIRMLADVLMGHYRAVLNHPQGALA